MLHGNIHAMDSVTYLAIAVSYTRKMFIKLTTGFKGNGQTCNRLKPHEGIFWVV